MSTPVATRLRARIEAFTDELIEIVRASVAEQITSAVGAVVSGGGARGRRPGRPRGTGAPPARRRKKGQKRSPKLLAATTERLAAYIAKNPGKRIEEISDGLGTPTKELSLPAKKLIAEKKIKTRGQRRATRYYPGGGRGGPKRAGKRGRKKAARSKAGKKGRRGGAPKRAKRAGKRRAARATAPAAPQAEAGEAA